MLVSTNRFRSSRLAALASALFLCSSLASAQPSGADKAVAETMFREGRQLMTLGKVAEACDRFAESQRLDPKLGTLLNLALCHEQQNKTASAWAEFLDAAGQARLAGQPDREQFAKQHASALEPSLSRLTISVSPIQGLKITVDGASLGLATLGTALPIDPGEHTIIAEAPGKKRYEARVTIPAGKGTTSVQIPNLEDAAPSAPIVPPTSPLVLPPPVVTPPPPAPLQQGMSNTRIAGLVMGSLGLAGLAVGGVTGGLAFSREAAAKKVCPNTACPTQAGLDLHDSARGFATASTIAFIGGGLLASTGVVLVVVGGDSASSRHAFLAPAAGGLLAGGRF